MWCDDCGKVSNRITNCWCGRVVCDTCRHLKHAAHMAAKGTIVTQKGTIDP